MSTPITTLCAHIRPNGDGCKGIPLTGKKLCYYHQRQFDRQRKIDFNLAHRSSMLAHEHPQMLFTKLPDGSQFDGNSAELFMDLKLPDLEDADAIQLTLSVLLRAIATGQVPYRAAGLMLYTLQIAAGNLRRTDGMYRDTSVYPDVDPEPIYLNQFENPANWPAPKATNGSENGSQARQEDEAMEKEGVLISRN